MATDLYEYGKEYVGRKTYVAVHGHDRFVPKYKTYLGGDGANYLRPEHGGDWSMLPANSTFVMPDKAAYLSPLDRTVVGGRTAHREHMKVHDVIEAGDMRMGEFGGRENAPMASAGHDIRRAIQELASR